MHSEETSSSPSRDQTLPKRRRWWVWILAGVVLLLFIGTLGFAIWANTPLQPMAQALASLQGDDRVGVIEGRWIVFQPLAAPRSTGFIFYPGGRVDPRAYAPQARAIAEQGFLVVITPMPLNLAIFGADCASEVMAAFPEVEHWVIGGHSLGGAMAANFAHNHSGAVEGMVLWAAYPAQSDSLADRDDLTVYSIYGTLDGLATPDKIEASRALLPATARFIPIEGGNHAQFGWYGEQPGDNPATIGRAQQQQMTVDATVEALAVVDGGF